MDKNYIKFVIAYDYGWVFEQMDLACGEAYALADEIANRIIAYKAMEGDAVYYDDLIIYCDNISFNEIWNEMKENKHG